jgi:hypothetical protein
VAVTPFTSVRHDPGVASERDAGDERELELLWRAADRASTWALRVRPRSSRGSATPAAEGPTGERYELSAVERLVSISRLLVWAPAALCATSLVLFVMSFLPR